MTITFNNGTTDFHPLGSIIDGYAAPTEAKTIVHPIINGPTAFTLRDASERTGELRVLMGTLSDADDFYQALRVGVIWTFADTDNTELAMSFVVTERFQPLLDDETRDLWWVVLNFHEVTV